MNLCACVASSSSLLPDMEGLVCFLARAQVRGHYYSSLSSCYSSYFFSPPCGCFCFQPAHATYVSSYAACLPGFRSKHLLHERSASALLRLEEVRKCHRRLNRTMPNDDYAADPKMKTSVHAAAKRGQAAMLAPRQCVERTL